METTRASNHFNARDMKWSCSHSKEPIQWPQGQIWWSWRITCSVHPRMVLLSLSWVCWYSFQRYSIQYYQEHKSINILIWLIDIMGFQETYIQPWANKYLRGRDEMEWNHFVNEITGSITWSCSTFNNFKKKSYLHPPRDAISKQLYVMYKLGWH